MAFKNALCLSMIPEASNPWMGGLNWVPVRDKFCQRKRGHKGPHRSWSREWNEGEKESPRQKTISKKDEDTVMRGDRLSAIRIIRAETPYKDLHSALGLLDGLRSGHVGVEEVFGDSKKQQKPCPHCRGTGLVDDNFSEPR